MEGQSLAVAIIAIVPTTIASIAAWRNARIAKHQTNGALSEPLSRIEEKLDDLGRWQSDHVGRWHNYN